MQVAHTDKDVEDTTKEESELEFKILINLPEVHSSENGLTCVPSYNFLRSEEEKLIYMLVEDLSLHQESFSLQLTL